MPVQALFASQPFLIDGSGMQVPDESPRACPPPPPPPAGPPPAVPPPPPPVIVTEPPWPAPPAPGPVVFELAQWVPNPSWMHIPLGHCLHGTSCASLHPPQPLPLTANR